jgi:hypothetical protein
VGLHPGHRRAGGRPGVGHTPGTPGLDPSPPRDNAAVPEGSPPPLPGLLPNTHRSPEPLLGRYGTAQIVREFEPEHVYGMQHTLRVHISAKILCDHHL